MSPRKREGGTIAPDTEPVTAVADTPTNGPSTNGPSGNGNGAVRSTSRLSTPRPRRRTTLTAGVPAPERGSASSRGSSSSSISKPQGRVAGDEAPSDAPSAEERTTAAGATAAVAATTLIETEADAPATPADPVEPVEQRVPEPVITPSPVPAVVPVTPAKRGAEVPDYPTATVLPPTLPVEPPPVTTSMTTHRVAPVPRVVGRRPRVRKVTRVVRHVDPWSVFKVAVVFNLVLYAVALTSGVLLWNVAHATGTIDNLERFFESFGWNEFEFNGGEIFHSAWIAGLFVVVGLTGAAVLGATLFNLITDLVGGVRLTVLEEEVVERTASPMRRFIVRRPSGDGTGTLDEPSPPSTNLPTRTQVVDDPFGDGRTR